MPSRRAIDGRQADDRLAGAFTPALLGSGTAPPAVTIEETSFYNVSLRIQMLIPGALGVGVFQYSIDGGPLQIGIGLAGSVVLPLMPGVTVKFSPGTYNADVVYVGVV